MKLIDLGWCMARLDPVNHKLLIVSPADSSEGFNPADSIVMFGEESLKALRDALNEAYPAEAKP